MDLHRSRKRLRDLGAYAYAGWATRARYGAGRSFVIPGQKCGYDPDEQLLEIELQDGKIYQYTDVPEGTYRGLMEADSHGRYFNYHVRGHSYHRIR